MSGSIASRAAATAERTIREEAMVLSRRDAEDFVDALLDPPTPSAKLRNAIEEHHRRVVALPSDA